MSNSFLSKAGASSDSDRESIGRQGLDSFPSFLGSSFHNCHKASEQTLLGQRLDTIDRDQG